MGSWSAYGVTDILVVLKQILRDAHRRGLIAVNPLQFLKNIPTARQPAVYWTETEINRFLIAAQKHPLYELFVVALNTGMRRGELAGLCWDRVDFLGGQLIISRTRGRYGLQQSTKTKVSRYIPMNDVVRACLQRCRVKADSSEFVFTDEGNPFDVNHIYRVFGQLQKQASIKPIRFHDLRHTFASQFMMKGGRPYDLQSILGHTSFQMTQRYAHLSQEHLREAMTVVSFAAAESSGLSQIYPKASENRSQDALKIV
jgi:integrase